MPPMFAIFAWPAVAIAIFSKWRPEVALLASLIGAFLLLPEKTHLNLPLLPTINKHTISALIALVLVLVVARSKSNNVLPGLLPRNWTARILIALLLLGQFGTVLTNRDYLSYGETILPGHSLYDGFSFAMSSALLLVPFLLARKVLGRPEDNRLVLMVLCFAALGYSLLALFEVRMSPQLHRMVYGFFPHSFFQHIRGDGFRPIVFLSHGLVLSLFFSLGVLATLGLARTEAGGRRGVYGFAAFWLILTLVLCKSVGALIITFVLIPVILFFSVRGQLIIASIIATIFLSYPVLRSAAIAPVNFIHEMAQKYSLERAASFMARVRNEDQFLEKALDRIHFGWGGWGRERVYTDYGLDISITDGAWIAYLGTKGWIGYVALFGLMSLPIYLLLLHHKRYNIGLETSVLALLLAGNILDLIPNSGMTPITWIIAGALVGRLEYGRIEDANSQAHTKTPRNRELRYTRKFGERPTHAMRSHRRHMPSSRKPAVPPSRK